MRSMGARSAFLGGRATRLVGSEDQWGGGGNAARGNAPCLAAQRRTVVHLAAAIGAPKLLKGRTTAESQAAH